MLKSLNGGNYVVFSFYRRFGANNFFRAHSARCRIKLTFYVDEMAKLLQSLVDKKNIF